MLPKHRLVVIKHNRLVRTEMRPLVQRHRLVEPLRLLHTPKVDRQQTPVPRLRELRGRQTEVPCVVLLAGGEVRRVERGGEGVGGEEGGEGGGVAVEDRGAGEVGVGVGQELDGVGGGEGVVEGEGGGEGGVEGGEGGEDQRACEELGGREGGLVWL